MMLEKLRQDQSLLTRQLYWLEISTDECQRIGIKGKYSIDEFGRFKTLCSRYSRSIDFLIRKIFRTIDEYEFENQGTLIDVINNAHKRGLITDIKEIRIMKDVRNTIVHEYVEEALIDVFEEVMHYSHKLVEIMQTTLIYLEKIRA
jgi:hypothetical protein